MPVWAPYPSRSAVSLEYWAATMDVFVIVLAEGGFLSYPLMTKFPNEGSPGTI